MQIGLIGATNVGKSTLFNRLIGQFRAIVTDIPGTTTDIIHHKLQLKDGETLTFLDSPGLLDFTDELPYIEHIVKESDLLLFLVDDTVGITAKERHILDLIRKTRKLNATILVVNKLDVKRKENETDLALTDYYDLGIANVIGISAKKERNLGNLLPLLKGDKGGSNNTLTKEEFLPHSQNPPPFGHPPYACPAQSCGEGGQGAAIAIVGKPNAGKSTLLNTLVGKPLAKVADTAGTTRDYLVGEFIYKGKPYIAYDTAGIKKKGSTHGIEKIAYDKTKAMLEFIRPIVVFMVDCTQGITHRDMTLLQEIHSLALPIIFTLNKVDQISSKGLVALLKSAQSYLDFAKYIPIVPIVATEGKGLEDMMKMVGLVQKENQKRVGTRELNQALQQEMIQRPPRFPKNKIAKVLYATQIAVDAPTFVMFVNHKSRVNFAFKKWIENTIRKHFGFIGVPIVMKYRNRDEKGVGIPSSEGRQGGFEQDEEQSTKGVQPRSNNPYNNKGKRKWALDNESHDNTPRKTSTSRRDGSINRPNETKKSRPPTSRTKPKKSTKEKSTKRK